MAGHLRRLRLLSLPRSGVARAGMSSSRPPRRGFLRQAEAKRLDEDLMGDEFGFSLEQLMELAGLAVACAVHEAYPGAAGRAVVACGPGNNGGDGLVAARHLLHFGWSPVVVLPRRGRFGRLERQLETLGVPLLERYPDEGAGDAGVAVDALFGFGFRGSPRAPYDEVVARLAREPRLVSVDVPSGWEVDRETEGPGAGAGEVVLRPDVLVSLTAPKPCARRFRGSAHFCGGRFVPPALAERYGLQLPRYEGCAQVTRLERW